MERHFNVTVYVMNEEGKFLFIRHKKLQKWLPPGGHVEENESYESCLEREILEETGIKITFDSLTPFLSIKYMNKDYPQKGDNSRYITNYYLVETDAQPNLDIINLTDDEKDGNLEIRYIHKDNILEELNSNLKISSEKNAVVVIDTIEAVKCYLESI